MTRYLVILNQQILNTASVTVEAESPEAAEDIALDMADGLIWTEEAETEAGVESVEVVGDA